MSSKWIISNNKSGSAMILFTVAMTVFLTIAAFVVDLGIVYCESSRLQNAADSAALAAGRLLPAAINDSGRQAQIISTVENYLIKNQLPEQVGFDVIFTDDIDGRYYGFDLRLQSKSDTGFAKVIGIDYLNIEKEAGVVIRPSTSAWDVVPVSVYKNELDELIAQGNTEHIILKFGGGDGSNGAFGAINLSGVKGGGANQYSEWVLNGYTTEISVGDQMYPVEPGNMAGPTHKAFKNRYTSCNHFPSQGGCNKDNFVPTCERVVNIPVVEKIGSKHVKILGFAVFILEDCFKDFNKGEIKGSYVESVISGTADFLGDNDLESEYGAFSITLAH